MGLQKPLRRHLSQRIWFTEAFLAYACPLSYLLPGLSFVGDCIVLITRNNVCKDPLRQSNALVNGV
ncbi:hypothetical protein E1A91_A10G204100v1 [Gossypium mustelinum]|uniref:Uncharacterized protein n=1 Tax=Gossypium mustelinum TaxID=34275 RepID=A0A5D2XNX9_GOSMU|nr:hypothetical protein E1A91_A10G204100v1 [Gossypium mustelinum]